MSIISEKDDTVIVEEHVMSAFALGASLIALIVLSPSSINTNNVLRSLPGS